MNGEQFSQLDERLRGIETNSSATNQQLSDMNERLEKVEGHVDEIRISLAKEEGAAKEAEKNAAEKGKRAGLIAGGLISAIITGFGAGLRWLLG